MTDITQVRDQLANVFSQLPPPVQRAIVSKDTAQYLRSLADKHKLHLDQWESLEIEVQKALLGLSPAENLKENIIEAINIDPQLANEITTDIALTVFKPIREELERELGAPQAREEEVSDMDKLREQVLGEREKGTVQVTGVRGQGLGGENAATGNRQQAQGNTPATIIPGTPPPLPPIEKIVRAPASGAYIPGQPSTDRANVVDDPYREAP